MCVCCVLCVVFGVSAGVAVNSPTTFWSVAGREPSTSQEPFLEWLQAVASDPNPPLVHSVSYADTEHSMPAEYTDRLNVEFQKAGVRGLTLLFASGDDGVASTFDAFGAVSLCLCVVLCCVVC